MKIKKLQKRFKEAVEKHAAEQNEDNWFALNSIFHEAMVMGRVEGLNDARITVWGFGYDNDETGLYVRRETLRMMRRLSEPYDFRDSIRSEED